MTGHGAHRKKTIGEEIANAVSHGSGVILSIIGMVFMIVQATKTSQSLSGAIIYGISLTTLYTASCIYHAVTNNETKKRLRIFDHCSIYLLIAGTYAPITISLLPSSIGIPLFIIISICAICGIVFKLFGVDKYKKVGMALYVIMGWMVVIAFRPLMELTTMTDMLLLIGGGLCYTIGIIFYKMDNTKYMHFVWHLFVLGGSICHYFFVLSSCYQLGY